MILAYLRTKLCSSKMKRDRSLIPSRRSRRISRLHRPPLGIAAVASTRVVVAWSRPARVVRWRAASKPRWQTPAVVIADDLTTTSIFGVEFYRATPTHRTPRHSTAVRTTPTTTQPVWVYVATRARIVLTRTPGTRTRREINPPTTVVRRASI